MIDLVSAITGVAHENLQQRKASARDLATALADYRSKAMPLQYRAAYPCTDVAK